MNDKEFLKWVHDRMVNFHGENSKYDYMIRFKSIIDSMVNAESKNRKVIEELDNIKAGISMILKSVNKTKELTNGK